MSKEIIVVQGNGILSGEVSISGAKNSALKLMAATILARGECVIRNVPLISDIEVMTEVLTCLGATVGRNGHVDRDEHVVSIEDACKHRSAWSAHWAVRRSISCHARWLSNRSA